MKTWHEVRDALGTDIRFVEPVYKGPALPRYEDGSKMNIWGIIKKPMPNEFYMEYVERTLRAGGGKIDAVLCGDDFGSQRGLLISPQSFDSLFAPRKKEFFDMVHSYGAKVTHHCCRSSRQLIPRFVELGMDALQTIQPQHGGSYCPQNPLYLG